MDWNLCTYHCFAVLCIRETGAHGLVDVEPARARVSESEAATSSRRTYMFATLFHELGFRLTVLLSLLIRHGPFSWNRPIMLELPGCRGPVSQLQRNGRDDHLRRR